MYFKTLLFCCVFFTLCSCTKREKLSTLDNFHNYEERTNKETYLDSLYQKTIYATNDSLSRDQLFRIAARYDWLEKEDKFKRTISCVDDLAKAEKDTSHQAKVLWYLGDYYDTRQIKDSAFYYYLKAEKLYEILDDRVQWAKMLSYKAGVLYSMGIYTESEVAIIKAIELLSDTKETRLLYEAYNVLSLILKDLKEYDEVFRYYDKITTLLKQLEEEGYDEYRIQRSWLSFYNNIGGYYNEINEPLKAQEYFKTAFSNGYVDEFPKLKAMLLNNYAYSQMMLKANPVLIDSMLSLSLEIREEINHREGIAASKIQRAEFELLQQDTAKAVLTMKEAYKVASENKSGYEFLESLKFLSKHDQEHREMYKTIYLQTQDSLQQLDRKTRSKFARIAYETNEIEKENSSLIKRNTYLLGSILVLILLFGAVFTVFNLRFKNKKLLHKQKEQQAVQQIQDLLLKQQSLSSESKNKERIRIAKDLHDGIVNRIFTTRINLQELPTTLTEQKTKLIEQLVQTEEQIRALAHDIHHTMFDQQQDFSELLRELALSQRNSFKTTFDCSIDALVDWNHFTIQQKTQVYLILQELLQNVNKHSQATRCFIIVLMSDDKISIRIHENGIGMNEESIKEGLGIKNIKDRVEQLKGTISWSKVDDMNIVAIQIPF